MIVAVPAPTNDMNPLAASTVATAVLLLLHVPPETASVSVIVVPAQKLPDEGEKGGTVANDANETIKAAIVTIRLFIKICFKGELFCSETNVNTV